MNDLYDMITDWMIGKGNSGQDKSTIPIALMHSEGVPVSPLYDMPSVRSILESKNAELRGFTSAVVREFNEDKAWTDKGFIEFDTNGEHRAVEGLKTGMALDPAEVDRIKAVISGTKLPEHREIAGLPADLSSVDIARALQMPSISYEVGELWFFRDRRSSIVFAQQRIEHEGYRLYLPWLPTDSGKGLVWRMCEPYGPLPLYNAHLISETQRGAGDRPRSLDRVFIHESPRAAAAAQRIADGEVPDHPWSVDFEGSVNVGWIGGALSSCRTDWGPINFSQAKSAVIVADHDDNGARAIRDVAFQLRLPTSQIRFAPPFPKGFDLADPIPEKLFSEVKGERTYIGAPLQYMEAFATWVTDMRKVEGASPTAKPVAHPRRWAMEQIAYIENIDAFTFANFPHTLFQEKHFNSVIQNFSESYDTAKLLKANSIMRYATADYRPELGTQRDFNGPHGRSFNTFIPSAIRPAPGDITPFIEFMEYLIPSEYERRHVYRWMATLIAKLDTRMVHSLLLISSSQGLGKNTLADHIIAPLVGKNNCSWISEKDINSSFNSWVARRRLIIVPEIYSDQRKTTYNQLKSVITDKEVTINEKYQKPFEVQNCAVMIACSNADDPLMLENKDRRWFLPTLTDRPWPADRFREFYAALKKTNLLAHIAHWAATFDAVPASGGYIVDGEIAPGSEQKLLTLDASMTELANALEAYVIEMNAEHDANAVRVRLEKRARQITHAADFAPTASNSDMTKSKRGNTTSAFASEVVSKRLLEITKVIDIGQQRDVQQPMVFRVKQLYSAAKARADILQSKGYQEKPSAVRGLLKDLGAIIPKNRVGYGSEKEEHVAMNESAEELIRQLSVVGDDAVKDGYRLSVDNLRAAATRMLTMRPEDAVETTIGANNSRRSGD